MTTKNYYVVLRGRKKGIFDAWNECSKQVVRYSNASYQGFSRLMDAVEYIKADMESDSRYILKIHGYDKWFNDYNSFIFELEQMLE